MPSGSLYLARAGPIRVGRPRKPSTRKPSSTIPSGDLGGDLVGGVLPRRKTTAMSQGSSSVRPSKGTEPKQGPTGLPLILCPVCEEYEVVERVSNTKANPRRRFFKCSRNEPNMAGKCTFFIWLERYQAHLVETGQLSMGNTYPEDAIPELFELSDKVREDVKSLKEEITELKEYIADMKMGRQNLGGVEIVKFVCVVNVVLVVLLVMVLLFK